MWRRLSRPSLRQRCDGFDELVRLCLVGCFRVAGLVGCGAVVSGTDPLTAVADLHAHYAHAHACRTGSGRQSCALGHHSRRRLRWVREADFRGRHVLRFVGDWRQPRGGTGEPSVRALSLNESCQLPCQLVWPRSSRRMRFGLGKMAMGRWLGCVLSRRSTSTTLTT